MDLCGTRVALYLARAELARHMAERAGDPATRQIWTDLATRYDLLAQATTARTGAASRGPQGAI